MSLEFGDDGAQLGLIVGQSLVLQARSGPFEGDGGMVAFADVDEYVD
ncbi:hypothetical protein OKW34_003362 [Paraburkholderia youngii]